MTHLPFIAGSYALGVLIPGYFAVSTWQRLRAAQKRLRTIDPRRGAVTP